MNKNKPFIIKFIGETSFLCSLLAILILVLPNFPERFGFYVIPSPIFSNDIMQILLYIILLIASYGFLRLKRWGYWLMITCNTFSLLVYIIWSIRNKYLFLPTTFMLIFIELIFILATKKYFYENKLPS